MTALEMPRHPILIPSDFTFLDEATLLVHQGAVWVRPQGDRGLVMGYSILCTETMTPRWTDKPVAPENIVTCFGCLGAHEQ